MRKVPEFVCLRKFGFSKPVSEGHNGDYTAEDTEVAPEESYDVANLISSETSLGSEGQYHMPVLDLDFEAHLEPSSTQGHFHLYLNKYMTWHQYVTLLGAMEYAGILEKGFVELSVRRGATYVRKPGVKKTKTRRF